MKPGIPKGTRDFLPEQVEKRNYIFSTIKSTFKRYGYVPIETPVIENLDTLTGKYGEEGDKLLFKILNNGDFLSKADASALEARDSRKLTPSISNRGLRYDLTVPFARFVTMHQNDIQFPFKRYQIQQVWRADRPQKGRYREFYQCDADVVGSDSLMYEAELAKIYDEVFHELGLDVTIKVNNRKVLMGLVEQLGVADKFMAVTIAIDKLDKIGEEGVLAELEKNEITADKGKLIIDALSITSLDALEAFFTNSEEGKKGIEELRTFHTYLDQSDVKNKLEFDISLARGLNYYTGCIFEVVSNQVQMGSIGGGGRYDDLTGVFGLKGVSGVGISFGAARIYDIMEELDLFPSSVTDSIEVLLIALDEVSHIQCFNWVMALREKGIASDLYPSPVKLKKQMKYANDIGVPYTIVIGSQELESGQFKLKNMDSGEGKDMNFAELLNFFAK